MITMTIPENMKPSWSCTINGVKYSFPAGETVEVPDEVAPIIQAYIDANTPPANPSAGGLTQPEWGAKMGMVDKYETLARGEPCDDPVIGQYCTCGMSYERYQEILNTEGFIIEFVRNIFGDNGDTYGYVEETLSGNEAKERFQFYEVDETGGAAYVEGFYDYSGLGDHWEAKGKVGQEEAEIITKIPRKYLEV